MSDIGQERYQIQHVGDRVDEISQLPDAILHHILSFIPTRDVVMTSVLSKRWNDLWTSVRNLDFDDSLLYPSETTDRIPPSESSFTSFVERVLLLRDPLDIEKFRLSCCVFFNASRIHSWISSAIVHNVKELDLCVIANEAFVLPSSLFCSKLLSSLRIEMNRILELPTRIHFPNLKTLCLSLITFPDDDSTNRLFAGCPVLEELILLNCDWTDLNNIMISNSTLKRFTIKDLPYFGPPDDLSNRKITIHTSNLMYLKYKGYLSNKIFFLDTSSLVNAYVSVPIPDDRPKEAACYVVNLLKGLRNVASLTVSSRTIETLIIAGITPDQLPIFHNLTRLEFNMKIGARNVDALMILFECCPNLQSLHFNKGFNHVICLGENDHIWSPLPECMSSHLRTLTFKNFRGYDSEICFLKCFLMHKLVSEKMNICSHENLLADPERQEEVSKDLKTIAKGSASCVVTFS